MEHVSEIAIHPSHCQPLTREQLEQLGVRLENRYDLELRCMRCGEAWAPTQLEDGSLPRGFWKCPNRCNW